MSDDSPVRPAHVSADDFARFRNARRGSANPEDLTNPWWTWLVPQDELSAWAANELFEGPPSTKVGAAWCNARFGQSTTRLPDGRVVHVAGEHEDWYDADFWIYNDVIVVHPDGRTVIWGYPADVFPPTDFHSATWVDDGIVIIGNLGYRDARQPGITPVYHLDIDRGVITELLCGGDAPGWLHRHIAERTGPRTIVVRRGLLDLGDAGGFYENYDDWALDLDQRRWTRQTRRHWPTFRVQRPDRERLDLVDRLLGIRYRHLGLDEGSAPPSDEAALRTLFEPPLTPPPVLEDSDDIFVQAIRVGEVSVRYVIHDRHLQITVEGSLPDPVRQRLLEDATAKLTRITQVACEWIPEARPTP